MLAALKKEKLRAAPGTRFVYSDIGFIVLGEIVERVSNSIRQTYAGLTAFFSSARMQLSRTFFVPDCGSNGDLTGSRMLSLADLNLSDRPLHGSPRLRIRGQNSYLGSSFEGDDTTGNEILRGQVHDPTSYRMGGVAGHAGLFSTADDLARYCQMLLNGGVAPGGNPTGSGRVKSRQNPLPAVRGTDSRRRILSAQTVARMTAPYVVSEDGATRGLGWDMNTSFSSEPRRAVSARIVRSYRFTEQRSGSTRLRRRFSSSCRTAFIRTAKATSRRYVRRSRPSWRPRSRTRRSRNGRKPRRDINAAVAAANPTVQSTG